MATCTAGGRSRREAQNSPFSLLTCFSHYLCLHSLSLPPFLKSLFFPCFLYSSSMVSSLFPLSFCPSKNLFPLSLLFLATKLPSPLFFSLCLFLVYYIPPLWSSLSFHLASGSSKSSFPLTALFLTTESPFPFFSSFCLFLVYYILLFWSSLPLSLSLHLAFALLRLPFLSLHFSSH